MALFNIFDGPFFNNSVQIDWVDTNSYFLDQHLQVPIIWLTEANQGSTIICKNFLYHMLTSMAELLKYFLAPIFYLEKCNFLGYTQNILSWITIGQAYQDIFSFLVFLAYQRPEHGRSNDWLGNSKNISIIAIIRNCKKLKFLHV